MKQHVTNHPVLRYYDVSKEVTLQCDASQSGLGAALLHFIFRKEKPKGPLMPQIVPDRSWSKVAVSLFTLDKTDYIIIVDDNSSFFGL